jgi:hypothetical protein
VVSQWLDSSEVMTRWELKSYDLLDLILDCVLTPYSRRNHKRYVIREIESRPCSGPEELEALAKIPYGASPEELNKLGLPHVSTEAEWDMEWIGALKDLDLDECVFKKDQIEAIERGLDRMGESNLARATRAPKIVQRHRLECRKVAAKLWEKDRLITIADMVLRDEINIVFAGRKKFYTEDTIRNWIKDLCPNRKPGRRPKK